MFAINVTGTRVKKRKQNRKKEQRFLKEAQVVELIRAIPETSCGHLEAATASRNLKPNIKASHRDKSKLTSPQSWLNRKNMRLK